MLADSGLGESGSIMSDSPAALRDFSHMEKKSSALRVLVVDDEPLIRWSLAETLLDSGHEVLEAGDARSAVEAVREAPFPVDVVLLDYRLPDSNDLGLLASLRRLSPETRVILMTAFGTPEVVQGALKLGAFSVVHKPLEMNDLATLVARAYDSRPH
ncbi:MAG: response regulator [Betaproteobacteria bacterium]